MPSKKGTTTHHHVVRLEDRNVLEDLPRHPDELWCDQAADGKHGNAAVLGGRGTRKGKE